MIIRRLLFYLLLALNVASVAIHAERLWAEHVTRQAAIARGSDSIPSAPPVFVILDSLGAAATDQDYVRAAVLLDDQLAKPDLQGVHYLAADDDLPQAIVVRLTEIEEATPVRSYKTFTGGEAERFMTAALRMEWQSDGTLPMARSIWQHQKLEDKLVGIHVNSVIFTPDLKRARADYLRITRITNGNPAILHEVHRAIGGIRTETHVYWLERGSDGIWRIRYLNDPVS